MLKAKVLTFCYNLSNTFYFGDNMKPLIFLVSSAYNEQDNIKPLFYRVKHQFEKWGNKYDFRYLILDNCSTDNTLKELKELAKQEKQLSVISNIRNFGHIRSPYYGILRSLETKAAAVILLASDLQDPPEMIGSFIEQWEKGAKLVLAQKTSSRENKIMYFLRGMYYKTLKKFNDSGANLLEHCTGFGLYDREIVEKLAALDDPYPYLRGIVGELGYCAALIPFEQPLREKGLTKNNFYTLYDNAMLGFTSHSRLPLRIAAIAGFILSIFSALTAFVYLILKLIFWNKFPMGQAPLLIAVFFFFSVQLFFMGIVGEYLGAVLTNLRKRPLVVEKERINF